MLEDIKDCYYWVGFRVRKSFVVSSYVIWVIWLGKFYDIEVFMVEKEVVLGL